MTGDEVEAVLADHYRTEAQTLADAAALEPGPAGRAGRPGLAGRGRGGHPPGPLGRGAGRGQPRGRGHPGPGRHRGRRARRRRGVTAARSSGSRPGGGASARRPWSGPRRPPRPRCPGRSRRRRRRCRRTAASCRRGCGTGGSTRPRRWRRRSPRPTSTSRSSSTTPMAPSTRTSARAGCRRSGARPARRPRSIAADGGPVVAGQQQVDRGEGGGAGQRVAHVGGPVRQHRHLAPGDAPATSAVHSVAASVIMPPVRALPTAHDVGHHARPLTGEQRTGAPEAGGDLVEHQQHAVLVARLAQHPQVGGVVEAHAPGALHHGLDDDRRQLVGVAGHRLAQLRHERRVDRGVDPAGRGVDEDLPGHDVGPQGVHAALGIAHRHGEQRVAVVAAPPGQQAVPLGPAGRAGVLQRHLQRDLDGHRPRVGEEHPVERRRRDLDQPSGQVHRGLVGEPAEHHVAQPADLRGHRRHERRVAVAVDRRPPRRHGVDQLELVAVGCRDLQPHAVGATARRAAGPRRGSSRTGARRGRGRRRGGRRAGPALTGGAGSGRSRPARPPCGAPRRARPPGAACAGSCTCRPAASTATRRRRRASGWPGR